MKKILILLALLNVLAFPLHAATNSFAVIKTKNIQVTTNASSASDGWVLTLTDTSGNAVWRVVGTNATLNLAYLLTSSTNVPFTFNTNLFVMRQGRFLVGTNVVTGTNPPNAVQFMGPSSLPSLTQGAFQIGLEGDDLSRLVFGWDTAIDAGNGGGWISADRSGIGNRILTLAPNGGLQIGYSTAASTGAKFTVKGTTILGTNGTIITSSLSTNFTVAAFVAIAPVQSYTTNVPLQGAQVGMPISCGMSWWTNGLIPTAQCTNAGSVLFILSNTTTNGPATPPSTTFNIRQTVQ